MRLDRISLRGFRNYEEQSFSFVPGVNLIVGDNAQGKTNLLESISYLSVGKSFRTRKEKELIQMGADFADLVANVHSYDREQTLRAVLFANRRKRQLFLGGVKEKSMANLAGIMTTVLFCPEDLLVLKGGAMARRRFLDYGLCQLRPNYQKALAEYQRLYEHKSRILKDYHCNPSLLQALPDFNYRMAQVGAILISYRAKFMAQMGTLTEEIHRDFSGGLERLGITYQTVSTIRDPLAPKSILMEQILRHNETHEKAELRCGQCLTGPHKDDFDVTLDGVSLKAFGSQGQTRTAAISLKLAQRQMMKEDTGQEPILLLDDVLSELDPRRQDFILNRIQSGQVFITCCEKDRLTQLGEVLTIQGGRLL